MFCKKCGKEIQQTTGHCPHCGDSLQGVGQVAVQDKKVGAMGILFFLFPIVGWIIYFVWKSEQPGKARSACKLAWIGFGVGVGIALIIIGFTVVISMSRFSDLSDASKAAACKQNQASLEAACTMYYANYAVEHSGMGKYPDTLEELVTEGFIDEMLQCPEGVPYIYNNTTGDVSCEQSSGAYSHLTDY